MRTVSLRDCDARGRGIHSEMRSTPIRPVYPPEHRAAVAWDEAVGPDDTPRPSHVDALSALGRVGVDRAAADVAAEIQRAGLTFGDDADTPFHVDPVPRVIEAAEWDTLARGLAQRARALDAFVADAHGPREAVREGAVPAAVLDDSPFAEPALRDLPEPPRVRVAVAGLDIVRDTTGRLRVLEDNCRTPSGLAFLLASREAVDRVLGVPGDILDIAGTVGPSLRRALLATTPEGAPDGTVVLLSDGPGNTAWWEHGRLAALMEVPLVTPEDLRADGKRLVLRRTGEPVAAVYRRTDEDTLGGSAPGPIATLLLPAIRAGTLGVMNAFGCGVADDKAVYPHVPDLIRLFCGEEPLLDDLPVYDLCDPDVLASALDRAEDLVFKPRDGLGGQGVTIGPRASRDELRRTTDAVRGDPGGWIAQDAVVLSTHPTAIDGALMPRHVDLRPFVVADGDGGWDLLPGALTRVALDEGEMVVNSSRGGGSKDTWVRA